MYKKLIKIGFFALSLTAALFFNTAMNAHEEHEHHHAAEHHNVDHHAAEHHNVGHHPTAREAGRHGEVVGTGGVIGGDAAVVPVTPVNPSPAPTTVNVTTPTTSK